MQQQTFTLWLYGPDGHSHPWTVEVKPYQHHGMTLHDDRRIILGSHLRTRRTITGTVIHEASHAALGPNLHEDAILAQEYNADRILKRLGVFDG